MIDAMLLKLLQEIDPNTYNKYNETELTEFSYFDDYGRMTEYAYADDLIESANIAWLQAVLQEEIIKHGWAITLTYNPPNGCNAPYWSTHIWKDDHREASSKAYSLIDSLLASYISAIEGN